MLLILNVIDFDAIRKSVSRIHDRTGRGQVFVVMSGLVCRKYLILPNDAKLFVSKNKPVKRTLSDLI